MSDADQLIQNRHTTDLNGKIAAVALIAVTLLGGWQFVGALRTPGGLSYPKTWPDFVEGRMTDGLAKAIDKALPARESMIAIANGVRYRITRGADDQVRVGTDGWLYLTDEVKYEPRAADNMALRVGTVAKAAEALKAQGVQLLVAVVPDKVRMVPAHMVGGMPAYNASRYEETLTAFKAKGVPVVDLRRALATPASGEPQYYHTDTHWNQPGAQASAQTIAGVVKAMALGLDETTFATQTKGPVAPRPGDLLRMMGLEHAPNFLRPAPDEEAPVETRQTSADAGGGGLLGDTAAVPVVLTGTSYSLRGNFHGYLQQALSAKVLNTGKDGGGFIQGMADYLADDAFKTAKPKLIIWELPERFMTPKLDEREKQGLKVPPA